MSVDRLAAISGVNGALDGYEARYFAASVMHLLPPDFMVQSMEDVGVKGYRIVDGIAQGIGKEGMFDVGIALAN